MRASYYWLTLVLGILACVSGVFAAENSRDSGKEECDAVRYLPSVEAQCHFAKANCASDSLIQYLQLFYCNVRPSGRIAEVFFQFSAVCLLLLIFRLLGSTADEFFSPILTQISQDLGLPPRFAGDLVSSIAFVRAGQYRVAISGLLGGGMFVGAAVAGLVISTAGGVKARGALLRDVSSYLIAIAVVAIILRSGSFTWLMAVLLLAMYLLFVAAVLAADIVHIWQKKRGVNNTEDSADQQTPLLAEHLAHAPEADLSHLAQDSPHRANPGVPSQPNASRSASLEMTEGCRSYTEDLCHAAGETSGQRSGSNGRDSTWSADGTHLTYSEKVHMSGQTYREMALAEMAHSTTFFGHAGLERARRLALLPEDGNESPAAPDEGYMPPVHDVEAGSGAETSQTEPPAASSKEEQPLISERSSEEERQARVQQWCSDNEHGRDLRGQRGNESASTTGRPQQSEGDGMSFAGEEAGLQRTRRKAWRIVLKGFKAIGLIFDAAEFPFTILRRVSVPLVDSDSYNRRWFVSASVGVPIFIFWYFGALTLTFTLPLALAIGVALGAVSYSFSTADKPPEWSLGFPFPIGAAVIACIAFVAAAMWIDTIAGELVALLQYFGTLSGIPHEVLGLTVLAWGNSVGDLSTNSAMAKRGLSNMAMTACFAGPIFNLLLALSLGFMRFLSAEHTSSVPVQLAAVDLPAIGTIFVNGILLMLVGLWHKSWVPAWYGPVPMFLYALYIAVSLAVAFG